MKNLEFYHRNKDPKKEGWYRLFLDKQENSISSNSKDYYKITVFKKTIRRDKGILPSEYYIEVPEVKEIYYDLFKDIVFDILETYYYTESRYKQKNYKDGNFIDACIRSKGFKNNIVICPKCKTRIPIGAENVGFEVIKKECE